MASPTPAFHIRRHPPPSRSARSLGIDQHRCTSARIHIRQGFGSVFDRLPGRPPLKQVADVVDAGRGAGEVEVDQSASDTVAKHDVLQRHIPVADCSPTSHPGGR
ncbi:MAG: hypothetical protein K0R99_4478 [Microbacterium sp.]|nr:hypothetical protein [Microbacterium sp.]